MITRVSPRTWLAFDGTMAFQAAGVVFRHPDISANFVYFDGHGENLHTSDVDGAANSAPFPFYVFDTRALRAP
jgi:prepilin-type processing-associated H-X9-DG protein